jgi:hypothetical protein
MKEIFESRDYDAFVEAVEGTPLQDAITSEADFEKFLEAHELRKEGDFEAAKELMDELGLERPSTHGKFNTEGRMRSDR